MNKKEIKQDKKYLVRVSDNIFFHKGFNKKYILLDNVFYEI